MFGDPHQCKYHGEGCPNSYILDSLCVNTGGRNENGKRAECYRDMSLFYRAIDAMASAWKTITKRDKKNLRLH